MRYVIDGIRVRRVPHPDADPPQQRRGILRYVVFLSLAGALLVGAPLTGVALAVRGQQAAVAGLAAERRSIAELQGRVRSLEAQTNTQVDWSTTARAMQPSIFTVVTDHGLGSGWVARAGAGGSEVVTNFHVVAEAFNAGDAAVHLRQGDLTIEGSITQERPGDDLALIHIEGRVQALE